MAATPDGRLIVLDAVGMEAGYDLSSVTSAELNQIFAAVLAGHNNKDLESVLKQENGAVIVVSGFQSTARTYWGGDEGEEKQTELTEFKTPSKSIKFFTADLREPDIVVSTSFYIHDKFLGGVREVMTYPDKKQIPMAIADGLTVADQTTSSHIDFDNNYWNPRLRVAGQLAAAGVKLVFFE